MRSRSSLASALALAVVVVVGLSPVSAGAWLGDFVAGDASGQAVYEDMAIHPQAVQVGSTTYVVYQGYGLDPHVVAFDGEGGMRGPFKVGENPLATGYNRDDPHGAPSLLYDPDTGHLHVFWGAHVTRLKHAQTVRPGDVSEWATRPSVQPRLTYPQVFRDDGGISHLFFRVDESFTSSNGTETVTTARGSWMHARSATGGSTWTTPTPVIAGDEDVSWYAHFEPGADGRIHMVATALDRAALSPFAREEVFYARLDAPDEPWTDVQGKTIATSSTAGLTLTDLSDASNSCTVYSVDGEYQNQVTCADDGSGNAGILFLTGGGYGPESYHWTFAGWDDDKWATTDVRATDHYFDAATLEYRGDSGLDAFVVAGGSRGVGSLDDQYVDRGGNIEHWHSDDGGSTWGLAETIATSDPDRDVLYNDPQIVVDHDGDPRLLFGEWDNDATNFVRKVHLWGGSGRLTREYSTSLSRLAGADRYETAVAISRDAYPNGSDSVVVASGETFADGLSGSPLAAAQRAPLLLTQAASAPQSLLDEVARLDPSEIIILGGTVAVSDAVRDQLSAKGRTIRRIEGKDRYVVAGRIARELTGPGGTAPRAFVASGEQFADALAVAPLAAARGLPILLTQASTVPSATALALASLETSETIVVGGPNAIAEEAVETLPAPQRLAGPDRYATARRAAVVGLDGGYGIPPTYRKDRFIVASGQVFPDALAGGVFAARARGPVLLTQSDTLSAATSSLIGARGDSLVGCYLLGGTVTLSPTVAAGVDEAIRSAQE